MPGKILACPGRDQGLYQEDGVEKRRPLRVLSRGSDMVGVVFLLKD